MLKQDLAWRPRKRVQHDKPTSSEWQPYEFGMMRKYKNYTPRSLRRNFLT